MSTKTGQPVKHRSVDLTYLSDPSCGDWVTRGSQIPKRSANEGEEELFCGMRKMLSFPFLCNSGHYSAGAAKPIKRHDSVEIQLIM